MLPIPCDAVIMRLLHLRIVAGGNPLAEFCVVIGMGEAHRLPRRIVKSGRGGPGGVVHEEFPVGIQVEIDPVAFRRRVGRGDEAADARQRIVKRRTSLERKEQAWLSNGHQEMPTDRNVDPAKRPQSYRKGGFSGIEGRDFGFGLSDLKFGYSLAE